MGYAFILSECFGCGKLFSYNPIRVPSIRNPETGTKEPVCRRCIEKVNPTRIQNGLAPITYAEDAYDPVDEEELPF